MKKLTLAALIAGQILTSAGPAFGADFAQGPEQRPGAFAGLRLRMPLDGPQRNQLRAGLTVAPTLHQRGEGGETRLNVGEGVELGLVGREPVRLSIAGTPVSRLAQGGTGPNGERLGVSTLGWVAIGVGAFLVVAAGASYIVMDNILDCDDGEDCT